MGIGCPTLPYPSYASTDVGHITGEYL